MNAIGAGYARFCSTRFPLPSESQVAALETRLGKPFPKEYREFLLNHNGGFFDDPQMVLEDSGFPKGGDCLKTLAGVSATMPFAELLGPNGFNPHDFDDNDPPRFLPIGYTMMGNMLFIELSDDVVSAVYLKKAWSSDCFTVAVSIDNLFAGLKHLEG